MSYDENNKSVQLKTRTKAFALRVIRLFEALPNKPAPQVIGKQVLRAGTSVAANYRAACRARSKPEFVARIGVVAEEADETISLAGVAGGGGPCATRPA